tara:strand:- start:112 stop:432 length:321 start_codon:yes stop_codon:yes gene_type:complete
MQKIFVLVFFLSLIKPPHAMAQIIGAINPNIAVDALGMGNPIKGFGFSALRYEDKQRLKRLRERYLELNPKNRGVVMVYDVEDDNRKTDNEAASNSMESKARNVPR